MKNSEKILKNVLKRSARKFCAEPILNHVKMIGNRSSYDIFLFHHNFRISSKIMIWHDILTIDEKSNFVQNPIGSLSSYFLTIMKAPIEMSEYIHFSSNYQK